MPRDAILRMTAPLLALCWIVMLDACAEANDVRVEVVDYDATDDAFTLQVKNVKTFCNDLPFGEDPTGEPDPTVDGPYAPSIRDLSGIHVQILGGGSFGSNICTRPDDLDTLTREKFYDMNVLKKPGPVNIQYNMMPPNIVVGGDHDSIFLLSAYTHLDRIRHFYHNTLGDDSRATNTSAIAVFDTEVGVGCSLPLGNRKLVGPSLPIMLADNAAYATLADMFVLVRNTFTIPSPPGVEYGINPGVLAHEYGHRVFAHNVYFSDAAFHQQVLSVYGSEEEKKAMCQDDTPTDNIDDCLVSPVLLKSMNEGVADILAYLYTGHPQFIASFSLGQEETARRDLSAEPSSDDDLTTYTNKVPLELATNELWNFYRLGTLWSRGFYAGIVDARTGAAPASNEERVNFAREFHGRALLAALREFGEDLAVNYRVEPRQLVRRYLQQLSRPQGGLTPSATVKSVACQQLCNRFGSMNVTPVNRPSYPADAQCASFIGTEPNVQRSFPCQL